MGTDLWPPNSPDLSPVKIWGIMQQRVYEWCFKLNNVKKLKLRLVDVWNGLQQKVIDSMVIEWRKRLKSCVHA